MICIKRLCTLCCWLVVNLSEGQDPILISRTATYNYHYQVIRRAGTYNLSEAQEPIAIFTTIKLSQEHGNL